MNAKKCDRCGKYYDHYNGNLIFPTNGRANGFALYNEDSNRIVGTQRFYDLCQECMKKLIDFIENNERN